ncbi:PIN domain-containing protein [Belliella sp. R4-6]|uniref:PIN domain-containing protein n=1 Tax=Belliella alkalica TaxID=1730871 RepID=A0ABS9VF84_9BACT|nr:PIN domain-containing protein [Belliella alkalica]MCH7414503.1 PIN domain-containing protein [Belliella alkalica]
MKNLFIDTNIIIDLLARREPFFEDAAQLFSVADTNKVKLSVSSLTIANTSYALLKQMNSKKAKSVLRNLRLILNILPLNDGIIGLALEDEKFSDFEDGLQYFTALEYRQDMIITRNLKDFKNSKLPTMTAKQFIEMI